MAGFTGIDVHAAPRLVQTLNTWPLTIDAVISLVSEAEMLSDLSINVTGELDQIGSDGRSMATAIDRAVASILNHKVSLSGMGSGIALNRLTGAWADGNTLADELALIHGTKSLGETTIGTDRIDELVAGIKRDAAAGRDSSANFNALQALLNVVSGDKSGAVAMKATSLLMAGVSAAEMPALSADGHAAALEDLALAMEIGLSPDAAGLHPLLFPAAYTEWHTIDAERGNALAIADLNADILRATDDGSIGSPAIVADMQRRLDALDLDDHRRSQLQLWLDNVDSLAGFGNPERESLRARLAPEIDIALAEVERLKALLAEIVVPNLHDGAGMSTDGRLGSFDAIGAASTMALRSPSTFVGTSYGAHFSEFDETEVKLTLAFTAHDEVSARAFFPHLTPEAAAYFLHDVQRSARLQGAHIDITTTDLARDFSVSLGHASSELPTSYAVEMIEAQPREGLALGGNVAPEWAFAYGDFDSDFLLSAGAASVALHGGSRPGGVTDYELAADVVDPRVVILEPLVAAGLGAELVIELGLSGDVDTLIWAEPAIREPNPVLGAGIPVEARLLLQAGMDDAASALLIDSAGSRLGDLELNIANGLSWVLAGQVANYVGSDANSPYFDAAENIFAAGAGVEIDTAARVAIIDMFVDGFRDGEEGWYEHSDPHGAFVGMIDVRKFIVFENNAVLADKAIENSQAWVSGLTSTIGIATGTAGIVGVPVSGGTSMAVAGVAASGAGWIIPILSATPDNAERFYRDHIPLAYEFDLNNEGYVLVAAAIARTFDFKDVRFEASMDHESITLTLTSDRSPPQTWLVDWHDSAWTLEVKAALDDAGATGDVDIPDRPSASSVLNIVGDPVSDAGARELHEATSEEGD